MSPIFPFTPLIRLSSDVVEGIVQVQSAQFRALMSWQRAYAAVGQDLWDSWAARYAGGVPIDA